MRRYPRLTAPPLPPTPACAQDIEDRMRILNNLNAGAIQNADTCVRRGREAPRLVRVGRESDAGWELAGRERGFKLQKTL